MNDTFVIVFKVRDIIMYSILTNYDSSITLEDLNPADTSYS
jgi:hypothetical protein